MQGTTHYDKLNEHFNKEKIKTACTVLVLDYENLAGGTSGGTRAELISSLLEELDGQKDKIFVFLEWCKEERKDIPWEEFFSNFNWDKSNEIRQSYCSGLQSHTVGFRDDGERLEDVYTHLSIGRLEGSITEGEEKKRAKEHKPPASYEPVSLEKALEDYDNQIVLLGSSGVGKSTLLKYYESYWAKLGQEDRRQRLPIRVSLRDFANNRIQNLREFALSAYDENTKKYLGELVRKKEIIWLLDSLDEVPKSELERVKKQIDLLIGGRVITSRPYHKEISKHWGTLFEVIPFTTEQVREFFAHYLLPEALDNFSAQFKGKEVLRNPLLLVMLVRLAKQFPSKPLPTRRTEIFKQYINLLISWGLAEEEMPQSERKPFAFNNHLPSDLHNHQISDLLIECFGWIGFSSQRQRLGSEELADKLAGELNVHRKTAKELMRFWEWDGLINAGLEFRHQSFQDYAVSLVLAKAWQSNLDKTWEFIKPRLHHYAWREPILLMVGQIKEQEKQEDFVNRVWQEAESYSDKWIRRDLNLAIALAGEFNCSIDLVNKLMDSFFEQRWFEVEVVGSLGEKAIDKLEELLDKPRSFLAYRKRKIIKLLGDIGGQRAVNILEKHLLSTPDDSIIQEEIYNALGKIGHVTIPILQKAPHQLANDEINQLGHLKQPNTAQYFLNGLETSVHREHVLATLAELEDLAPTDSEEVVLEKLFNGLPQIPETERRWNIIHFIGFTENLSAIKQVKQRTLSPQQDEWEVCLYANMVMGWRKDEAALHYLGDFLVQWGEGEANDDQNELYKEIVLVLRYSQNQVVGASLSKLLQNKQIRFRQEIIEALGELRAKEYAAQLVAILEDETERLAVREAAARALGQMGDPLVVDKLLPYLQPLAWEGQPEREEDPWRLRYPAADALETLMPHIHDLEVVKGICETCITCMEQDDDLHKCNLLRAAVTRFDDLYVPTLPYESIHST